MPPTNPYRKDKENKEDVLTNSRPRLKATSLKMSFLPRLLPQKTQMVLNRFDGCAADSPATADDDDVDVHGNDSSSPSCFPMDHLHLTHNKL